ncbi:unnamed protein product [Effrenium voratum]|uniref:SecA DEAD-like N-terminal domain-containing protein n=1 Tax=Effrenium voratum TaxID=2562239 RepID=A0AA36J3R6_9DINO|nr:unnamed protein product [Effrenium voratum]CAJ1451370.1 unnamed protein product [Effrenium voratum]
MKCLEEHREFLPKTLMPLLGPYGCQALEGEGLSLAMESGKAAARASLTRLSTKMLEDVQSKQPADSERLLQLCKSTELNAMLGTDLEEEYILKPMAAKLAPSQGNIDNLAATMESLHTDDWHAQLLSISERITSAGEHGSRVLSSVDLSFEKFSAMVSRQISTCKEKVTTAVKKLLAPKCVPEVYERSWAALSWSEIPDDAQDTDSDRDAVEEAEAAISHLEQLLPADTLLKVMWQRDVVETVTVALQCVGWTLHKNLSDALKRAKRRAHDKAFIPTHSLGTEIIRAMQQVKALASLSDTLATAAQSLQDHACINLNKKLSFAAKDAAGFIDDLVKKELGEWEQADVNIKGWPELFNRHLSMANQLRCLDNDEGHVRDACAKLFTKVKEWREQCFKEATQVLEAGGFLENPSAWCRFVQSCIKEGLAFEQSALCGQLGFQTQFRPMVEAQCEICHQEAASAQQNLKLATWQKLTTLISALQQLQTEDARVGRWVKSLMDSREPLNVALEDDESRFEKALAEGRFSQAAQLLHKVPSRQRHGDRLIEHLLDAMSSASKCMDDDTEVETIVSAVKEARRLIQEVDCMEDSAMRAHARKLRDALDEKLARKSEEAKLQLQLALDGRHAASCALQLRAKMINKSQQNTAREAVIEFAQKKKQAFATMSVSELVTWIIAHDRTWRHLPQEFKISSEEYEELLQVFQSRFVAEFTKEFESLFEALDEKRWGGAREHHQDLKNAVDVIVDLELLKSFRAFKKLQTKLQGSAGRSRCMLAKDNVKKGEFDEAICVVVTSNGEKEEVELLDLINEQVVKNLRPSTDPAALYERMTCLGRFLEAVGENPPDELAGLAREASQAYHKARPEVEQKALAAVTEVLEAATAMDLGGLAAALANFQLFEGGVGVTESRHIDVAQAQQKFWRQIRGSCDKVASSIDVANLDVHSLSLSLEPLKGWLGTFEKLSLRKKQALLQQDPPDLQAWMRDVLAEPVRRVLEPTTVMSCVESRRFTDISRRCSAAKRLREVLQTEPLDLAVVEQHFLQRKAFARQALDAANFQQFNSEVKVCKLVSEELAEVPVVTKILADLENDLRERFLNLHMNKLRSAQNIPDAATASQEVRQVANSAPDTHAWVTSSLEEAFESLQNSATFNVKGLAALGLKLLQTPLGRIIVAEHPAFFNSVKDMQSNELFRRAGESQNLESVVGCLTRDSGLDGAEYHELVAALHNHEVQFDDLKNKYLCTNGGRPMEDILKEAKHDLDWAVQSVSSPDRRDECALKLVAHISICFTLVKSGRKYLDAPVSEQEQKLVIPHMAQILTLFRFLQCHRTSNTDQLWKRALRWVCNKVCGPLEASQQPENHLSQVLTGEGKCLTLGLLASFLALNGLECDIVCYRKFLTEQDSQFMEPFYKFLGVERKIRYLTFDELCEERLAHIREGSKELIFAPKGMTGNRRRKLGEAETCNFAFPCATRHPSASQARSQACQSGVPH